MSAVVKPVTLTFSTRARTSKVCGTKMQAMPPAAASTARTALQFMVDMSCQGCVKAVRNVLEPLEGVDQVDVDLSKQSVVVFGSADVDSLLSAFAASNRRARLIGQGMADSFVDESLASSLGLDVRTLKQSLAAVVEYKGRDWGQGDVLGVVRFVQFAQAAARVEATLSGLAPGEHCLAIHSYGDLTSLPASVGPVFRPDGAGAAGAAAGAAGGAAPGLVCRLLADENGNAQVRNALLDSSVQVWDIIGRALVIHKGGEPGADTAVVAGVIARSATVGENQDKKICACDGTVIWDSSGRITSLPISDKK